MQETHNTVATNDATGPWHLVCVTASGVVSILRNLDLRTARLTYQKLLSDTRPVEYLEDEPCGGSVTYWRGGDANLRYSEYGGRAKAEIVSVEAIGPDGEDFEPWHGVEPRVVDNRGRHMAAILNGTANCSKCSPKPDG